MSDRIENEMEKDFIGDKLASQSGESIAETLVALLIASLALVMLAGAMSSSVDIVTGSKNKLDNYYKGTEDLFNDGDSNTGTVTISSDSTESFAVSGTSTLKTSPYEVNYVVNNEFGNTPVVVYQYDAVTNPDEG